MEAGELAKTMTNLRSNLKGKRSIAMPSKDIERLSQLFFWFGIDFAEPAGMSPFYRHFGKLSFNLSK